MKTEKSRLWIGGWVAMALFCGAAGCSDDEPGGGETPPPDASGDAANDATVRMDVTTDGGSDARDADASTSPDSRDATNEPTIDRTNPDVRDNDGITVGDADGGSNDGAPDVPTMPPNGFSIGGILGTADTTADAWLMGGTNPTVQWAAAMGAWNYEVTIYEDDGTTVKCAAQTVDGTATSAAFASCALTEGLQYKASVVATAGMFKTPAMNDKFRFAVGAVVWGQPDGKSNEGLRRGLALPQDAVVVGTKLIVADQNNSRVLIWNTVPTNNYQQADIVLGQRDLTTASPNYGGIGAATFNGSNGVASDGVRLVVGDRFNNRVLIWNTFPTQNNQAADVVLGQPDFKTNTENTGGISARSMTQPWVWLGGGKLFVSDRNNARVLIWNTIPTQNYAYADVVLGQPDSTSNTPNNGGVSAWSIADPGRGWVDGTRLFVPDYANHRVLIWNTIPIAYKASADAVLGQSGMDMNAPNSGGTVGTTGLHGPLAVYASGNTIAVADYDNNRVAIWNTPIAGNGQPSNIILGQGTTTGSAPNAGGLSGSSAYNPCSVAGDGTRLIVTDRFNHRILIFPTVPTMTGVPASFVVGQPDTVSGRLNNGGPITASSLSGPAGLSMLGNRFAVADTGSSRVLLWDTAPSSRGDLPKVVLGQPNFVSSGQFGGVASSSSLCAPGAVHSDGTRLFIGEQCAHRVTSWSSLPTLIQQPADGVLGQPDLMTGTENTGGVSASSLLGQASPFSDGTRLFVADARNHRVLIWNTIPNMLGKAADIVLGQPNMGANTANNGGISSTSLSAPSFVYAAGGKLFVADAGNNRVLIWNSIPTSTLTAADVVLGQPDMASGAASATASATTLNGPNDIHLDANGRLYVTDPGNNRILYWNAVPTQNQAAASGAMGQPNMDVGLANNGGLGAKTLQRPGGVLSSGNLLYVLDQGNDRMLLTPKP